MSNDSRIFAFVLMPFTNEFDDFYRFGIKEPASQVGVHAERVDEQLYAEGILERIYRQIDAADIVIADMSGQNPNVFYEVGYAHAKDKLCILATSNAGDIPFDLKHRRHIIYSNSVRILKEKFIEEINWAKKEIQKIRASGIKVVLGRLSGSLERDPHFAVGSVAFRIDLVNESEHTSAEIEAIYFYSTLGWRLTQDGKECSAANSDLPEFKISHFLSPPVRRLQRGIWAPVKFNASKTLAQSWKGEEIRESYRIKGKAVVRIATDRGNFDHAIDIDLLIDEIPF